MAASSPITPAQISGLVAASLSEYRAYSPARASVSNASAAAASGVRTGIHLAAAGTISRTAPTISSTPSARHPLRGSARIWFASSANLNVLYAPPRGRAGRARSGGPTRGRSSFSPSLLFRWCRLDRYARTRTGGTDPTSHQPPRVALASSDRDGGVLGPLRPR